MHIPGYRIIRKINHGGMSTVYLSIQESVGRVVALKVMSPALNGDPTFSERFQREANIVGQLSHPNIVSIYDIGRHNNLNYIAMDYLPGGSIHDRMLSGMPADVALRVLREIASALDHAHSKGYIHRDIKPENILFRDDGSAVLTDFGVARALSVSARHTHVGVVVGTPHYMSPEQTRGKKVDSRSDLYSLGIVFYEMLTGSLPYQGEEPVTIALKHLASPIPTLPGQFIRLQPLLDKLLNKEPDKRHQRGSDLVEEIEVIELELRNGSSNYLAAQDSVSRQFLNLFALLFRQAKAYLGTQCSKFFIWLGSWRFSRAQGFYRKHTPEQTQAVLTRQNTLIATRIQRQLSQQGLWNSLRYGKHRYTILAAATVFIAGMVILALLPRPTPPPIAAAVSNSSVASSASSKNIAMIDTSVTETATTDMAVIEPTGPETSAQERIPETETETLTVKVTDDISPETLASTEDPIGLPAAAEQANEPVIDDSATVQPTTDTVSPADTAATPAKVAPRYSLTIQTTPANARVRIMNIRDKYQPGIRLTTGRYKVEVTHPGFRQYLEWVELKSQSLIHKVTLEEVRAAGTVFSHTLASGGKGPSLVSIPAGNFSMGGPDPDTQPRHKVTLKAPFAVTRNEITFAEYERFARAESMPLPGDNRWGRADRPVINISWEEAGMYAHWLSKQTGYAYRLPTEAEWEYVARSGGPSPYWWGNKADAASKRANCRRHCDSSFTGIFSSKTAPVGSFEASPFGVYDTAGNVAEWVEDCYQDSYKNVPTNGAAVEQQDCAARAVRGGSMRDNAEDITVYKRRFEPQHTYHEDIGFRLVVDLF